MSMRSDARARMITRGDDAASSRSANLAIREAFERGILRNTSVMAVGPELEHAAATLAGLEGLCVGLHVSLNCEWSRPKWGPVLPAERVPTLVDDEGYLTTTPKVLHERQASTEEMIAEVKAQLERLREVGFRPRYIDTHMGVDWVGDLKARIDALAEAEGLIRGEKIEGLSRLPRIEGGPADPGEAMPARVKAAAEAGGLYLVVGHPCYDDEEMAGFRLTGRADANIGRERDGERRMFADPMVVEACREWGVEPIRYDKA